MTSPLVLSLFPGIGLLDMAFEEMGFCVVRGPDLLWGGDVRRFSAPPGRFDGVIGGPPCQAWSRLRFIVEHNGFHVAPDLIPEYERIVAEAAPRWFVMEEVAAAPVPVVVGYEVRAQLLRDVWVGGETLRMRRISFGTAAGHALPLEQLALHRQDAELSALASGSAREVPVKLRGGVGHTGKPKRKSALSTLGYQTGSVFVTHLRKQGLPADFLADAPFTMKGKIEAVGNGVPLPMGRAIAKAVRAAMYPEWTEVAS
jgi:DNA (cytosine-5)-methyltransferase 1